MKTVDHQKQLNRLKRIEGQVRGVASMIEREEYCIDILAQIRAAKSALKSLEIQILQEHLNHCVKESFNNKTDNCNDKIQEIVEILKKI